MTPAEDEAAAVLTACEALRWLAKRRNEEGLKIAEGYLNDCADAIEAQSSALAAHTARIAALEARVKELEAGLRFYSCADGCNECPEHERDRVNCGLTARALIGEKP